MAKNLRKRKFLRKTLKKKRRKHRSRNFRKKKRKSYKKKYIKNKTRKRNCNKKKIIQKGGLSVKHQNILDIFDRDAMKLGLPVPIEKLVQEKQLQSLDTLTEVSEFPKSKPVGAIHVRKGDLKNHVALKGQLQDNLKNTTQDIQELKHKICQQETSLDILNQKCDKLYELINK